MIPGMEQAQLELATRDPFFDAPGKRVRTHPKLSGEVKLAWAFLRKLGGFKFGVTLDVTPKQIGDDQGVSPDAGRARLKTLLETGLIKGDQPERGIWRIKLQPVPAVHVDNFAKFPEGTPERVLQFDRQVRENPFVSAEQNALDFCDGNAKRAKAQLKQWRRWMEKIK